VRSRRKILLLLVASVVCIAAFAVWWFVLETNSALGTAARWIVRSHDYKAKVLAQPDGTNGELKHVEWDSWGWAGENTTVYLVFDPADALSQVAHSHQSGQYNGIPCKAVLVRRLESHWYTVRFFTNDLWRPGCRDSSSD
jgi:hypothetical protein